MPPTEYKKFIQGLHLESIKVISANFKVTESFGPPAEIKIKDDSSYKNQPRDKMIVSIKYTLLGVQKNKAKQGLSIDVNYNLTYSSKRLMDDKIFNIFSESSLRIQTWPYFRQFVHQMSFYMNIPPLVLDTIKSQ
jgi:preprotein translocase subunit SecB